MNYTVLADFHVHTLESDGSLTPLQTAQWLNASGYNAAFISDHQTTKGYDAMVDAIKNTELEQSLLLFPAMEWTSCRIHMNLLNIQPDFPVCGLDKDNQTIAGPCAWPDDNLLQFVINKTHEQGGLVIVNHLPWSFSQFQDRNTTTLQNQPSLQQLYEWGVDGIEIIGGNTFDMSSYQFAQKNNMIMVTGTDMHRPYSPSGWTTIAPTEYTKDAIWNEIKQKRTGIIYDPEGLRHIMPRESLPVESQLLDTIDAFSSFINSFVTVENGQWDSQGGFCHNRVVKSSPLSIVIVVLFLFFILFVTLAAKVFAEWLYVKVQSAKLK